MPDRNNKITGFSGDTLQVFSLKPAVKNTDFSPQTLKQTGTYPKKTPPSCGFFKDFSFIIAKYTNFFPTKQPRQNTVKKTKNYRKFV